MKKDELLNKFIELNEKTNVYMDRISHILSQLNDQNKLHKEAIDINTQATKEMTKSFNRIWVVFFLVIFSIIVLALDEKANFLKLFFNNYGSVVK